MAEKTVTFEDNITPEEYITLMFERTDEDGVLYIPWLRLVGDSADEMSCRCRMDWNLGDYEKVLVAYKALYSDLCQIAKVYDSLGDDIAENKRIIRSECVFATWNTYIREYELPGFDIRVINDIGDRLEVIEDIKKISQKIANEEYVDDYEKSFLKENIDVTVTLKEEKLYNDYLEASRQEAEKRVGPNICAATLILYARRLCKLLSLEAPAMIIANEKRLLASAMVIHKYAKSMEIVDDSVRYNVEKLEYMTEEELDTYFTPLKKNSQKSMAPLFVYLILKEHSSNKVHLRQQEILKYLNKYPYEIVMERKALSRIIHNLLDSQLSVCSDKTGVWIES